jgi:hypothetical protein
VVTLIRTFKALRALAIAIALACSARATLWVSVKGDDQNPGTEDQPFRSIEHARDVVRTLNHDMADDITVFIAGEYHVDRPIAFGPEDSGTNGFSIIYTAAPDERPLISGALRVAGWSVADKARGLWSAPAPAGLASTRDLFVNGMPATRTRRRLLAAFTKEAAAAPPAAPDPRAQWKNGDDVVFEAAEPGAVWSERAATGPVFVENAFELLGTPGEWYFDRPARLLYYTPRPGEDMATADVEAAVAQELIVGRGTADRPISGLVFKGIRFEYTESSDAGMEDPTILPPEEPPGAVRFANATGIQFLEDEFLHFSTPALGLGPSVASSTVEGCLFGDVSWSAVRLEGASGIRIVETRFSFTASDHIREGAIDVDRSADIAIEHDQFDHFPTAAVVVLDSKPGAVHRFANWVAAPMLSLNGAAARNPDAIPAQEIGISEDYRALEDERFSGATIPRPPTDVSAEAEDELAYVTWIPSCRDGSSPVQSYTVASSTGTKITVGAATFERTGYVTMEALDDGHPVNFTVSASNAIGTSAPSLATSNVTPKQKRKLRAPRAPALVSLTARPGASTLQITPPTDDGGSPIVSYAVTAGPAGKPVVIEGLDVIHADAAHPVTRTLRGLVPAAGSTVSVAAVNVAGEGKPTLLVVR